MEIITLKEKMIKHWSNEANHFKKLMRDSDFYQYDKYYHAYLCSCEKLDYWNMK